MAKDDGALSVSIFSIFVRVVVTTEALSGFNVCTQVFSLLLLNSFHSKQKSQLYYVDKGKLGYDVWMHTCI